MIGPQQMRSRRRQELGAHLQLFSRIGCPDQRQQRRADEEQQQHGPDLEADMVAGACQEGGHADTRGRGSSRA